MLDLKRVFASAPKEPNCTPLKSLATPWTQDAKKGAALCVFHPHPQFQRESFHALNGLWDYAFVSGKTGISALQNETPPKAYEGKIRVPFSPEAPLSGVNRQLQPDEQLWYRRYFYPPEEFCFDASMRCLLHFEAVDYACACFCNGVAIGSHTGGYLPFTFDITEALRSTENELCVVVSDPSETAAQLRGKQRLKRGGIWYTAQSGIWQTVWLEVVPDAYLESLVIEADADLEKLILNASVHTKEELCDDAFSVAVPHAIVRDKDVVVGEADFSEQKTGCYELILPIENPRLWDVNNPYLYDLEIICGKDRVMSYCAFRSVSVETDSAGVPRVCLNHKPIFLRGVLDQGYWPDGLMSAPSDEALVFDILACKNAGFTMLRKHIKVESDRWYYHCDRLGMLVWQDMVCGGSVPQCWPSSYKPTLFRLSWDHYSDGPRHYKALASQDESFRREWRETSAQTIRYLANHPCIITWALFNEGWGQFDAKDACERVRSLDPSRLIDATSGWYDQRCGDFLSVHNYFRPLEVYKDHARHKRAFVISECGGLTCHIQDHSSLETSYGYEAYDSLASFQSALDEVLGRLDSLKDSGLAGFVYTQLSDVEEETNGLITYDRKVNKMLDNFCQESSTESSAASRL